MRTIFRAVLVSGLAAAGAACTSMRAETPVERPALEVPPPPPRVVVPLPKPLEPLEPVAALGPGTPLVAPRPRAQRDRDKDAANKPEPPKPEEAKPVEPPAPAPPVTPPPPQLRMPETANSAQLARQISEAIGRARALLDKVDYRRLSTVATKAYEESKVFAQQADDELKANNLVLAKELADKAERLAEGLQGRWSRRLEPASISVRAGISAIK